MKLPVFCDFCGTQDPSMSYPCARCFIAVIQGQEVWSEGAWMAPAGASGTQQPS
jgi:hypothetical protein